MSYSICRIAKIKASGVTGMQIHDRREKDGVSHTNVDIDWTRKDENVDLLDQRERFRTVVNNRISELNLARAVRKDATVMCQVLITSDHAFFEGMSKVDQMAFFKRGYEFVENRYGKENMVSATVHFDERTPHMHVNFVPVTPDGRLSAKDLFGPKDLRKLQDDFNRCCREHGYDLKRGEVGSDREHLSVEAYKIETKYEDLKCKMAELNRLESIDKSANLQVEKGKVSYSTKDVDAVRDQNKALKVESHHKSREIETLKHEVSVLQNRLSKAQSEIESSKLPLERLKDVESEFKAFSDYIEGFPKLKKAIEPFEVAKDQAYTLGSALEGFKTVYVASGVDREASIRKSHELEVKINACDHGLSELVSLKKNIAAAHARLVLLEGQLKDAQGIFKAAQRKELQADIAKVQEKVQSLSKQLKDQYRTTPDNIEDSMTLLRNRKVQLQDLKAIEKSQTDNCEAKRAQAVTDYKIMKAISNTQGKPLRAISDRRDARVILSSQDERIFRITKEDRSWILDKLEQVAPHFVDPCRESFHAADLLVKERAAIKKSPSMSRGFER